MAKLNGHVRWLAPAATILSLVACYGTLAAVAVLALLGIQLRIHNALWAGAIVSFATIAVIGLALGARQHRALWPLAVGAIGAAGLAYVMTVSYDRFIEIGGFLLIGLAAVADWRKRRSQPQSAPRDLARAPRTAADSEGMD